MVEQGKTGEQDTFISFLYSLTNRITQELGVKEAVASECVGLVVEAVQAEYGAKRVYVHAVSSARRNQVLQAWADGMQIPKIALEYGLSVRQVYNIVSG